MPKVTLFILLVLTFICGSSFAAHSHPLLNSPKFAEMRTMLNQAQIMFNRITEMTKKLNLGDLTVECALCGIAVNEIEGFVRENITMDEIEKLLKQDICSFLSGEMQQVCNGLVNQLPVVIKMLENLQSVSVVCVELGWCSKPFTPHVDPQPIPTYVINLDLPPLQRWTQICSVPAYRTNTQFLYNVVQSLLPDGGQYLEYIGEFLNDYYFPSEYAQEIKGCAAALGVPYGWASLFNIGYEVSDACTSIVAQTVDGKIYHARNMDFWAGEGFTDTLKNISFIGSWQKGGKPLFVSTSFAGYVGILSGMRPNVFSITIDTRFYPGGIGDLFYEIIAAIIEQNAHLVSFLSRDALTTQTSWSSALNMLSNTPLIADVYYIIAGTSAGQGAVISRNRLNATDVWILDSPTRWFEVETNYDHWEPPPWFDDRVTPANNAMNAMGQKGLTLDGMLKVLTIKPVLNIQTTYTILACPADSSYRSWTRYCPYPCVE